MSLPNVAVSAVIRQAPVHACGGASSAESSAEPGASVGPELPPSSPQAARRARRTRWRIGQTIACEDAAVKPSTTSLPGVCLLELYRISPQAAPLVSARDAVAPLLADAELASPP